MNNINIIALADGKQTVVNSFATNQDIQNELQKAYYIGVDAMKKSGAANAFKGNNIEHTARNVWHYLKSKIQYEIDRDGWQFLRLPPRFIKDGVGDCKSFSLFAASVLGALGYPVYFVYTNYTKNGRHPVPRTTPTHVYITTRDERGKRIIIDGVYNFFNQEKPYFYKKEIFMPMKIAVLSGLNTAKNQTTTELMQYANNPVLMQNYKARVVETNIKRLLSSNKPELRQQGQLYLDMLNNGNTAAINGKAWTGFKKVTLSGARGAFLVLVKLNFRGLATKLNILIGKKPGKEKLEKKWKQLGGSFAAIKKAIEKGKNKKPLLGAKKVNGIAEPVSLAVILGTAGAIIAAMAPLLRGIKLGKDEGTSETDLLADLQNVGASTNLPTNDGLTDEQIEKSGGAPGGEKSFLGIDNNTLLIGAAAVAFVFLSKKN